MYDETSLQNRAVARSETLRVPSFFLHSELESKYA